MEEIRSLCWLRRDLRLSDSAPLSLATSGGRRAAVAFIWDDGILSKIKDRDNRRVSFIHDSLEELDRKLRGHGSRLVVRRGDPTEEVPKLAQELKAQFVCWGEDYEPDAIKRDGKVVAGLKKLGIEATAVKNDTIFHRHELLSQSGSPFKVFTPYAKCWRATFEAHKDAADHRMDAHRLLPSEDLPASVTDWSLDALGFRAVELWREPGEDAAKKRLKEFASKMADYAKGRDFPALDGTSTLSVDLRFGTLSIREAVRASLRDSNEGSEKWLAELIWRDFYKQILFHFPYVVDKPFQTQYEGVKYPGEEEDWEKWRVGATGYPLVDAAMRCLNLTGFMHNRLRMVVASFLSKDLLLDYRRGEKWFAKELLDYDLSSNNGGWQWASSVGCDPQPYFRIFNPLLQSKKFDPDGEFIRRWVPELKELSGDAIHFPADASEMELMAAGVELGTNYPLPCVDHATQKKRAVALLESARG